MDDAAAEKATEKMKVPYIPHEIVTLILARLSVESLLRFSCVCKAWRSTISSDPSFHRAHLRLQKPSLLLFPLMVRDVRMDKIVLYRLGENLQQGATPPTVHASNLDLSSKELMHELAHCDGLVLVPGEATVHVLNPSMRRALTLPWSPAAERIHTDPVSTISFSHQAYGFGRDRRSDVYKVARFFYRSRYDSTTGEDYYTGGMEVFTIGTDQHWRETEEPPPYPVLTWRRKPATYFQGSLVWTMDESMLGYAAPGFLRFRLENEAFAVMPPPPCHSELQYSVLSELRGELCLACKGADSNAIEMWMCGNIENPRWDQRYTIKISSWAPPDFNPIAIIDDEIVFKERYSSTRRYDLKTNIYKDVLHMEELRYHNPMPRMPGELVYHNTGTYMDGVSFIDVFHYVPSLIPV